MPFRDEDGRGFYNVQRENGSGFSGRVRHDESDVVGLLVADASVGRRISISQRKLQSNLPTFRRQPAYNRSRMPRPKYASYRRSAVQAVPTRCSLRRRQKAFAYRYVAYPERQATRRQLARSTEA